MMIGPLVGPQCDWCGESAAFITHRVWGTLFDQLFDEDLCSGCAQWFLVRHDFSSEPMTESDYARYGHEVAL